MLELFGCRKGIARPQHTGQPGKLPVRTPILAVGRGEVFGSAVAANLRNVASTIDEVVLDGAGHFLTEERPDEVVQLLLGFFADEPPTDDRGRANPAEVGALACATLRSQPMAILNGAEF